MFSSIMETKPGRCNNANFKIQFTFELLNHIEFSFGMKAFQVKFDVFAYLWTKDAFLFTNPGNPQLAFDFKSIGKTPDDSIPDGIAIDTNGHVYVADFKSSTVYVIDPRYWIWMQE